MYKLKNIVFMLFLACSFNANAANFDGAVLSLTWCLPFVCILLSIALCPIFLPQIWNHHYGKIGLILTFLFIIPFSFFYGITAGFEIFVHAIFDEFIPFILLLLVLFTVSGGIYIHSNRQGTPLFNVCLLAIGTLLSSFMGTTGAAMLMIRPLLRANQNRSKRHHIIIFFIFLVANIGGGLTPLGDPPLFIGFLKGVDFTWTITHMFLPMLVISALLLAIFYVIDSYYFKKEAHQKITGQKTTIEIKGKQNILLLIYVVTMVLVSGIWDPNISFELFGTHLKLQNMIRDVVFIVITLISLKITAKELRKENEFNWEPILEVAKLFFCIFITIAPVIAILKAGSKGELSALVNIVNDESGNPINNMYFWFCGILSGFLDNAPTYLVFFNLASGDATELMTQMPATLLAISISSVFMGALTYIGNAPNLMIRSIAEQNKFKMPSFIGYMKWSFGFLLPLLLLINYLFI